VGVRRLDRQPAGGGAVPGHGVAGVDGQVEQGVFQPVRVGADQPEAAADHKFQRHGLAQGAAQHLLHAHQQARRLQRLGRKRLAAGEGQQVPGQAGAALHAAARGPQPGQQPGAAVVQDAAGLADAVRCKL